LACLSTTLLCKEYVYEQIDDNGMSVECSSTILFAKLGINKTTVNEYNLYILLYILETLL